MFIIISQQNIPAWLMIHQAEDTPYACVVACQEGQSQPLVPVAYLEVQNVEDCQDLVGYSTLLVTLFYSRVTTHASLQ